MDFQPKFAANIKAVYGEVGILWLQHLPDLIDELCMTWDCRFIQSIPNLTFNFVGLVEMESTQRQLVLKIAPPGGPVPKEIKWLKHFNTVVPEIIQSDESKAAFLMERCKPGHSLKELVTDGNDFEATRILCSTVQKLQASQQIDHSFKHLVELIPDLSSLTGIAPPRLLSKAIGLFGDLTQVRAGDILLHGDLHHDNVINHGDQWKVIDPHGYMGDPVSEIGVMIFNPVDAFPTDRPLSELLESRLRILCGHLPYDPKKMQGWAFCKTMLSAAWNVQDFKILADTQLEIAAAIDKMKV